MQKIVPYYKLKSLHEKIIGDVPLSIFELIFMVEAPSRISGYVDPMWVERLDIEDIKDDIHQITKPMEAIFPYYELFQQIWSGNIRSPLIFEEIEGELMCIEGRHRLHVLNLFYKYNPYRFKKVYSGISSVIVVAAGEGPPQYPDKWDDFKDWQSDHSFMTSVLRMRKTYEKFLHTE